MPLPKHLKAICWTGSAIPNLDQEGAIVGRQSDSMFGLKFMNIFLGQRWVQSVPVRLCRKIAWLNWDGLKKLQPSPDRYEILIHDAPFESRNAQRCQDPFPHLKNEDKTDHED